MISDTLLEARQEIERYHEERQGLVNVFHRHDVERGNHEYRTDKKASGEYE